MLPQASRMTPKIMIDIPSEFLLNNFMINDFYRMFYPLNLMLKCLISKKYTMQGNILTPTRRHYYITMYFIFVIIAVAAYYCGFRKFFVGEFDTKSIIYGNNRVITNICFYIFYCIYMNVLFILNISKSHSNILLILRLQMIHETIFINKTVKKYAICIWFLCFLTIIFNLIRYTCLFLTNPFYLVWDLVFDIWYIAFDINFIYAMLIIKLLREYLRVWKENVFILSNEQGSEYDRRNLEVYQNILEAFRLYKENFQLLVCLWSSDLFFRAMVYLENCIDALSYKPTHQVSIYGDIIMHLTVTSTELVWIFKDLLMNLMLTISCEKFYTAIEDIKSLCLLDVMHLDCSDTPKRFYKNILQLSRVSFNKISVFGLFTVDSILPLSLLVLLTNYVCVLLQFALEKQMINIWTMF